MHTLARPIFPALTANTAALALSQPDFLPLAALPPDLTPSPGRDASPTLKLAHVWWKSCSVPRAASRAMLESLVPSSTLACFLHPFHPAAIAEALSLLSPTQAVVALLESPQDLTAFLACDDFSADIAAHRLFFCPSTDHLASFLAARPGLPTPGQFIRTDTLDDATCRSLIETCQSHFGHEHARRLAEVARLTTRPAPESPPARFVLATTSRYTPFADAPSALAALLPGEPTLWPHDDPLHTSPLALLALAHTADAVITADLYRDCAQSLLPPALAFITLATRAPIPPPTPNAHDRLILTHAALEPLAKAAGWSPQQYTLASLPQLPATAPTSPAHLALLADTSPIPASPPAQIEDFSSHRLLWERIQSDLTSNPLLAGADIVAYISARRAELAIPEAGFPLATFAERLAIPLWQQSLARVLVGAGVPLRIHGAGWATAAPDLAGLLAGPLTSPAAAHLALCSATALLPPYPLPGPHPIHSAPRPLLPLTTSDPATLARRAPSLLAAPPPPPTRLPTLTATRLLLLAS